MMREFGKDAPGPKPGKYPLGNRLYHLVVMIAGLGVIVTGILMMSRVRNPIVARNPYLMSDRRGASPTCCTASPASASSG